MNSYLTYRSQRGRVNNRNSDFLNISIIRLLLLLLLLNINIFMDGTTRILGPAYNLSFASYILARVDFVFSFCQ